MAAAEQAPTRGRARRDDLACCEEMARAFRALGNPTRLGILRRITESEMCVGELREELDCRQPAVSQHLGILRDRGIVTAERDGAHVCYRVADPRLGELLELAAEIFGVDEAH